MLFHSIIRSASFAVGAKPDTATAVATAIAIFIVIYVTFALQLHC